MENCAYRNTQLIKDLTEALHLLLHIIPTLIPESHLVSLLESNSSSLLERRNTAIADAGVCASHILDQMLWSDEITNTPSSGIEGFTSGTHREGTFIQLGGKSCNSGERNVEETIVNFIRQDDQVVLDTEVTNAHELLFREHFADRVVTGHG